MDISVTRNSCRLCGGHGLEPVLDLGPQALTGVFPSSAEADPPSVPLALLICDDCMLLQLAESVNPALMYKAYWYRSGINDTMSQHLKSLADEVISKLDLASSGIWIDIGCNDGTLLRYAEESKLTRIGVDPSNAIEEIDDPAILTVNDFFPSAELSQAMSGQKAKVITSISMFYDLDEPALFIEAIKAHLDINGIWILEMNYTLDMISNLGYDMVSHEHVTYYTLLSFSKLLEGSGLHINDVSRNDINGGSIRIFVSFSEHMENSVTALLEVEKSAGLDKKDGYIAFAEAVESYGAFMRSLLKDLSSSGHKIAAYGASTRGNTLLQHWGITECEVFVCADKNPGKVGLRTPGSSIPIKSENEVRASKPDFFLVLPYSFTSEFEVREKKFLQDGGRFIVPLPSPYEVFMDGGLLCRRPLKSSA